MSYPNREKYTKNLDLSDDDLEKILENTTAKDFLLCNPSYALANENYGGMITKPFFHDKLHTVSLLSYEGLIKIYAVSQHSNQNTVFITGFRGCGKTTFSTYLSEIVNDNWFIDHIRRDEFYRYYSEDDRDDAPTYIKMYSERFERLLDGLLESVGKNRKSNKKDYVEIHKLSKIEKFRHANDCIEKLNSNLKGSCFRFNLETDIDIRKDRPITQKLRHILIKILSNNFNSVTNDNNLLNLVKEVFSYLRPHFLAGVLAHYRKFFEFILTDIVKYNGFESIPGNILETHIESYTIADLLGSIMLMDIFQLKVNNVNKQKLFYIFDNLDIIENTAVLHNFLAQYNGFVTRFSEVVNKLRTFRSKNVRHHFDFNFTEDYCCIFFMRDTTARRINEHDNGRLYRYSINFDCSEFVDKGKIVLKRYDYVINRPVIENINPKLYEQIIMLSNILTDDYIRLNVAGLFNNDYVRFITCLMSIVESNYEDLKEYLDIMRENESYSKESHAGLVRYGARGIIFRAIFNHFQDEGYLKKLDINGSLNRNRYTQARLVLFYLFYKQPKHYSSFLDSRNTLVTFSDLRRDFYNIFNDDNETNQEIIETRTIDVLADVLWKMYDLKKSSTWAHLVTFDALYPKDDRETLDDNLTQNDLKDALNNGSAGHIAITCAGRSYVELMCSHFEYFSMRFNIARIENRPDSTGFPYEDALFLKSSYNQNTFRVHGRYVFEILLERMHNDFSDCLNSLMPLEKLMFDRIGLYNRQDIFSSPFVFHPPGYQRRHLERTMHRMITYLDAYRLFLVNNVAKDNETQATNFNRRMIDCIIPFVELMENSKADFSQFSTFAVANYWQNINHIAATDYKDRLIHINYMEAIR